MGKKNRTKHVIGCDLDASFIIENKRTRHCNSTMHELSTSFDKNLSKEKKKEEAPKTVVHECNVSTYSDTDKCYGFEHSENEKRKLLFFTELLEKMEMKNKNHMKSLSSGLKHCTVNINRLSTKVNYRIRCLIHEKFNCECIKRNLKTCNNKITNTAKHKILKGERNFAVKSTSQIRTVSQRHRDYRDYPVSLSNLIDKSTPHRLWRLETVPGKFTEIKNTITKDAVTYEDLIELRCLSAKLQKTVRLPFPNDCFSFCDVYGMYVTYKENSYVYFGPYSFQEDHYIILHNKIGKKKIEVPIKNEEEITFAYHFGDPTIRTDTEEYVNFKWCINSDDSTCISVEPEKLNTLNQRTNPRPRSSNNNSNGLSVATGPSANINSEIHVIRTIYDQLETLKKTNGIQYEQLMFAGDITVDLSIHKKGRSVKEGVESRESENLPRQLISNVRSSNELLPKMVLLCLLPGIGYLPIIEYSESKIIIQDPVKPNTLHKFPDVSKAAIWLDKYFKSQLQFEENVSLTWRVVVGCTRKLYPLKKTLFKDTTLVSFNLYCNCERSNVTSSQLNSIGPSKSSYTIV